MFPKNNSNSCSSKIPASSYINRFIICSLNELNELKDKATKVQGRYLIDIYTNFIHSKYFYNEMK